MAPFVFVHIAVMIYAVQGGLSAAEILSRTQGSLVWFLFYSIFVFAVSLHSAIGIRVIVHEIFGIKGRVLSAFMWIVGLALLILGMQAVLAVTIS